MITILMMSAKVAALKIEVFWNKAYDIIISAQDVTKKVSHDSNCIVDVVKWLKFDN